jgi:hypothetical protein
LSIQQKEDFIGMKTTQTPKKNLKILDYTLGLGLGLGVSE